MSYLRFRMDLAIKDPIPSQLVGQLNAIRKHMLILQSFSEKINAGRPNEENTVMLDEHICNHDIGKACERSHALEISPKKLEENKKDDTMGELCSLAWIPYTKWGLARRK